MTSKWSFWRDWIFLIGFLCRSNSLETRSFFLCAGPRQVASRSQKLGVGGFPFPNCSCLLSASRQSPSPSPTRASFRSPSSLFLNCSFFFFFFGCVGSSLLSTGLLQGFPGVSDCKESACSSRDLVSIPGSGRSPWRREWQPTSVSSPGESHGQRSPERLQSLRSQSPTDKHFHFSISSVAGSGGCSLVLVCGLLVAAEHAPGMWALEVATRGL